MVATQGVAERLEPVYRLIEGFIARGEIAGAGLEVALGGEPAASWYAGEAAPGLPSGPTVVWPLASISKVYTAAAVLALVEQGTLALSTPVSAVLTAFTGDGREAVCLRHLLTHTAGLTYESPRMAELLAARTPLDAIVDEAYTHPLLFTPGTRLSYSDYGYALAGRMAEAASGTPLPELIRRYVLEPGQLRDTFMPVPEHVWQRLAHVGGVPAAGSDGEMYNSAYSRGLAHPAFGVAATAADLLRFGLLFAPDRQTRILSRAAIRAMTTDQTGGGLFASLVGLETTTPQPWGAGFWVRGAIDPLGINGDLLPPGSFGHPGASGCVEMVNPADGFTLAYVSNRHLASDITGWSTRLNAVVNTVTAALTRGH
jgi:CubicO group peptidase (beta-lactamase class C family)